MVDKTVGSDVDHRQLHGTFGTASLAILDLKDLKTFNIGVEMDVATISANGQITLPVGVRKRLQPGPGDQVVFVENEQGDSEEGLDALVAELRTEGRPRTA